MALTASQKKWAVGGAIGGSALLLAYGILGRRAQARGFLPMPGEHHRHHHKHRDDDHENDRGEYGHKKKHHRHHGGHDHG